MTLFLILLQATVLITSPLQGDTVAGAVNIVGTATHPQFARYEIAFAYDPNPTDTWFEIQPPARTQVTESTLAVWDTTHITDGNYMLRLRVYAADSNTSVEIIIRDIQVRNTAPTETPLTPVVSVAPTILATPTLLLDTPTATPLPLPTATAPSLRASTTPLPTFLDYSTYTSAFCNGAYLAGGAFLLGGIYLFLRDRIRRPIRRWIKRIISDIRKP